MTTGLRVPSDAARALIHLPFAAGHTDTSFIQAVTIYTQTQTDT